jgi:Fe-S-cluster containining protein
MSCTATGPNGETYDEIARCSGDCCERFYLPYSPEEIAFFAEFEPSRFSDEIRDVVWPMLIYVEKSALRPDGETDTEEAHYYTCRNFDRETRNCRIYDHRPKMCANYPYGNPCFYKACTMRLTCAGGTATTGGVAASPPSVEPSPTS